MPWLKDLVRAQRPLRLPVVLTVDEVRRVIDAVDEPSRLIVKLLYGSGLRLLEALTLRVKDVDFGRGQVTVRDPKWKHDRVTMLPASISAELSEQLVRAAALHEEDLAAGFGRVWLPDAIDRKFPSASRDWRWQWVFPRSHPVEKRDGRGPASLPRDERAARRDPRRPLDRHRQACRLPHLPTFLRDPPSGARSRHSYRPGASRPPGRIDDHDLHPRPTPRCTRRPQPAGPGMMNILCRAHARSAAIHRKSHDRGAVDIHVGRTEGRASESSCLINRWQGLH